MNLNTFGGVIKAGHYDVIIAHGTSTLEPGVRFRTLVIHGVVDTAECVGGAVVFDSGMLTCSGDVDVEDIQGHGRCHVAGGLRCETMRFIGEMNVNGGLRCRGALRIVGYAHASSIAAREGLKLVGRGESPLLRAHHIVVKPIRSAMFERFGMRDYIGKSEIHSAEAHSVRLWNCDCGKITAENVQLNAHTSAKEVIYGNDLNYDRSSNVIMMRRVRDDEGERDVEAQRKVA
ncbi:hypothetical protein [Bifidobacterium sp. ESL0790]|uniref:hypothetical protein n=1 Tax=Bifidobacterium sp. ESL0790 TaxID=2983233 RepID=UPI0023F79F48|nr:hypothetical protein [Bifidobacterium sp. ESL0790]WEV71792.1 hypothetical protein OZY47_04860 [Bifidobacterium sp. ESL0790]